MKSEKTETTTQKMSNMNLLYWCRCDAQRRFQELHRRLSTAVLGPCVNELAGEFRTPTTLLAFEASLRSGDSFLQTPIGVDFLELELLVQVGQHDLLRHFMFPEQPMLVNPSIEDSKVLRQWRRPTEPTEKAMKPSA